MPPSTIPPPDARGAARFRKSTTQSNGLDLVWFEESGNGQLVPPVLLRASTAKPYEQHVASSPLLCSGGHGTLPYEQKTQQPPGFARTVAPHDGQSQKNWQLSFDISAVVWASHWGHVIVDVNWTVGIG